MKAEKHPKLANGQPAISCFAMSQRNIVSRMDLAHARAEAQAKAEGTPGFMAACLLGQYILWHVEFPKGLRLLVCDNELFRLTADLPAMLLEANGGSRLDFFDYGYVADLLRAWLLDGTTTYGDAVSLRRALAWVEQQGSGLRDFGQE